MTRILLVALLAMTAAGEDWTITMPTENLDGSSINPGDIIFWSVYCDGDTEPTFGVSSGSFDPGQSVSYESLPFPVGPHSCEATVTNQYLEESARSNAIPFDVAPPVPMAPVLEFVGT